MAKLKIKKGDTVKVISGAAKGKTGLVTKVYPDTEKVVVEGINMIKKHTKPSAVNPQGGIIEKEAPIHISNVMLLEGDTATKIGRKEVDGKIKRYAKKSGNILN